MRLLIPQSSGLRARPRAQALVSAIPPVDPKFNPLGLDLGPTQIIRLDLRPRYHPPSIAEDKVCTDDLEENTEHVSATV